MTGEGSGYQARQAIDTKIAVLLTEYSALRDEVLQRATVHTQILTVAGASVVGIITIMVTYSLTLGWYLLVFLGFFSFTMFKLIEFDVVLAAKRLREIEADVNSRVGERLLVWETDRGLIKVGYAVRYKYALRSLLIFLVLLLVIALIASGAVAVLGHFFHVPFVDHIVEVAGQQMTKL